LADFVSSPDSKNQTQLTERELTMLRLVADGATTEELAQKMFLSEASVKRGIHLIFEKLNVRNRSEAVSEAYKRKLL
jgi:LuxR family transcriptional regulator, maltose regulon positive regulatory protein